MGTERKKYKKQYTEKGIYDEAIVLKKCSIQALTDSNTLW